MKQKLILMKKIYDYTIRNYLPKKIGVFNGVPVRKPKLFDLTDERPNYEKELIKAVSREINYNDKVVIIGGGLGVSTVRAARQINSESNVIVYEPSINSIKYIKSALSLSPDIKDQVIIIEKSVGNVIYSYFGDLKNDSIHPSKIKNCDLLQIDAEGAEIEILKNLEIKPRVIVVETHSTDNLVNGVSFDCSSDKVIEVISDEYEIKLIEEVDNLVEGFEINLEVITAVKKD